jgi:hypothetical protein
MLQPLKPEVVSVEKGTHSESVGEMDAKLGVQVLFSGVAVNVINEFALAMLDVEQVVPVPRVHENETVPAFIELTPVILFAPAIPATLPVAESVSPTKAVMVLDADVDGTLRLSYAFAVNE